MTPQPQGLTRAEAEARWRRDGPNTMPEPERRRWPRLLAEVLREPMLLLLLAAAGLYLFLGDAGEAAVLGASVLVVVGLTLYQSVRAERALQALRALGSPRARALRDGTACEVPAQALVVGDVILLAEGDRVPADARLCGDAVLSLDESLLTGESLPVRRAANNGEAERGDGDDAAIVRAGTWVVRGDAIAEVVATGERTALGRVGASLRTLHAERTPLERDMRRVIVLFASVALVTCVLMVVSYGLLRGDWVQALLAGVTLAMANIPEEFPVVLSVFLALGGWHMAQRKVLVRRPPAIEALGAVTVLCTDKTGTLTEGRVTLHGAWSTHGAESGQVLQLAAVNAGLQTGIGNPLDAAILAAAGPPSITVAKVGEVPYDFVRRRVSVAIRDGTGLLLVTKGAVPETLGACAMDADGFPLDDARRQGLLDRVASWNTAGIRVLAVASRALPERTTVTCDCERGLELRGFLTFRDNPKEEMASVLAALTGLGVSVRMITGDAAAVARHIAVEVGLGGGRALRGTDIERLDDRALQRAAEDVDLFVEVDPNQKERVIRALRRNGHVVGFMGDGINDAPAMHAADTSMSVESAADVARDAADFVLLGRDLDVVRRGIVEGRRTSANTLKYLRTTTSANLGNMISMAAASLMLPFLPLTAGQVLLNNFLSDVPAVGIADDAVDAELVSEPRGWDMAALARFMLLFGLVSSAFDFLTFWVLIRAHEGAAAPFRTGWFVESLLTELAVALVVRTRRPFWRSRPGRLLAWSTAFVAALALAMPWLPGAALAGFVPLPFGTIAALLVIVALYVAATEGLKRAGGDRLLG